MKDAVYLDRMKEFSPKTYSSFRLTSHSIDNINKVRSDIRKTINDIDRIINHLKSLMVSYDGQYYRQSELERLITYYRILNNDFYNKEKELNNSLIAVCKYIINNNKDSADLAKNILNGLKGVDL